MVKKINHNLFVAIPTSSVVDYPYEFSLKISHKKHIFDLSKEIYFKYLWKTKR